jgi:hypothetical protein
MVREMSRKQVWLLMDAGAQIVEVLPAHEIQQRPPARSC